jgi:hypothetical protein
MGKTAIALAIFLSACTHVSAPLENPRQVWCDHNTPRRDARQDSPRKEIDEINTHNRRGALWCGWKP